MSRMSTKPVLHCVRCGGPVIIASLETYFPDEEGKVLFEWMRNLNKIAMCERCKGQYDLYAPQGRTHDWAAGRP